MTLVRPVRSAAALKRLLKRKLSGKFLLLFFHASWCSPCKAFEPVLVEALERWGGKSILARGFDVDLGPPTWIAKKFKVRAVPTILLLRGCREVARRAGVPLKKVGQVEELKSWLEESVQVDDQELVPQDRWYDVS